MKTYDINELQELLDSGQYVPLRTALTSVNHVDIAAFIEDLPIEKALLVYRMLPKNAALYVFSMLPSETQHTFIESISDKEIGFLINSLWVDDVVDMLEEMPAILVNKALRESSPDMREIINQYLNYPEDSTGSIMTAEFVSFKKNITALDALKKLKLTNDETESIYTCFVTDETRILQGVVSLRDILFSDDNKLIGDIMTSNPVYATTTTDRDEAIKLLVKYDLIILPVVDSENRLVGIVTVDDAVDVMIENDTEDFEKMAAIVPSERPYMKTSAFRLARNRFPWLLISLGTNMILSFIVDLYAWIYVAMPILVSFIPMLMGTGGNAGSQTSTLVIRGMALSEIGTKNFWAVLWKEVRVCLLLGSVMGTICFVRILLTYPGDYMLSLIIAVSLFCAILVGKTTGALLPMLAKVLKADPALMAAPLITTIVDIATLLIFFNVSIRIFNL